MEEIADGIFVETAYEGVNVGAIRTRKGLICIDAPSYPRDARHWITALSQFSARPVRFTVLTDHNGDRILNTRWLNAPIITHHLTAEKLNSYEKRYPQALLDALIQRNAASGRELANGPVDRAAMSFSKQMSIVTEEYTVSLIHMPGPTKSNLWLHIPEAGVLFTGDSLVVDTPPLLAEMNGPAWLDSLAELAQGTFEASKLVPGRGPITAGSTIETLREYLQELQACAQAHFDAGQPREKLAEQAANFLDRFPHGVLPAEWIERQIRNGLDRAYVEIQSAVEQQAMITEAVQES